MPDTARKHSENRQRRHMIGVRVTGEELAALTAAAKAGHTSVPDLLRTLGLAKAGLEPAVASRRYSPIAAQILSDSNGARCRTAAQRDVAVAQRALDTAPHPEWPLWWGAVAKARVDLPEAPWAQVGARIGISKDSAVSAMRRIRVAMAQLEAGGD